MERVFLSLKSEWLPKGGYGDFSHAVRDINQWINGYYNVYRPHINNDGLPPCLHEEKWKRLSRCLDFVLHYIQSLLGNKGARTHTVQKYSIFICSER